MGSLRNPVGPLPSSIYWRRRAVLASVFALLAIIATWAVSSGGKKASTDSKGSGDPGSHAPITPGPSQSGPAISQYPGGRGESGSTGSDGSGGSDSGTDSGTDSGADAGTDAGTGKNGDPGGGSTGSGSAPVQVPAGSPLPNCAPGTVRWTVRSAQNSYEPAEKPRLELAATNTSGTTCKVDLGPRTAVLTITRTGDDKAVWSSADCPADGASRYFRVPAQSAITHAVEWDRKTSDPAKCGAAPAGTADAGTYLVEVRAPGLPVLRTSFVLTKD